MHLPNFGRTAKLPIQTIDDLKALYRAHGVTAVYVKRLSPKQDNDKNQIYLGSGMGAVLNLFAAEILPRSASDSEGKRKSEAGRQKLEARIDLAWMDAGGGLHPAPNARIIDYFQYPEIRLSGFLKGCDAPPDALRRTRQAQYGQRILFMGSAPSGQVIGYVLTALTDPVVAAFPELPLLASAPVLRVLTIEGTTGASPADLLHQRMAAISAGGWHTSRILRAEGAAIPFRGAQGGGYTLEALLGVRANADKAPDFLGYEIKSFSGSRISLMTPTPDGGFQGDHDFRTFMGRYGRSANAGDGSRRFTGLHKAGVVASASGLLLEVTGYDPSADAFADPDDVAVRLRDPDTGEIAASWSLNRLAGCWNRKHASAAYIPCERREAGDGYEYHYRPRMFIGEGTDVWRLLRAIHAGVVFYDPADTIYADGKAKVRSQWRINASGLLPAMQRLYASASVIDLAA